MGVPAFFRWLSNKFPKVATAVQEEIPREVNGQKIPVDTTKPNPNGEEFDNLYLDMNGIIHPCCHPEGKPAPETEDDMMIEIFAYMDRIVDMVRPRKVLYMAIDGVAPRAKMNQQRSRRFRASQLAEEERKAKADIEQQLSAIGQAHQMPEEKQHFDSNCITPGTPFMAHLATCLRYHIAYKQNTDPLWKNMKVILSDATVPGEGEHKIMEYIRVQRAMPHHNPNTSHVIYGLDADLIMLALGTHEPYFKILREDVFDNSKKNVCHRCNQPGHIATNCAATREAIDAYKKAEREARANELKPYVFLHVNVLREYLEHALKFHVDGIEWDFERAIDDWVFMCFFVGNDFLPHLPSLEIREGAISTLSMIWKQVMPIMGGYMTHNGDVDLRRVQILVTELGKMEDEIFSERKAKEDRRKSNQKRRKLEEDRRQEREMNMQTQGYDFGLLTAAPVGQPSAGMSNSDVVANRGKLRTANYDAAAALRAELGGGFAEAQGQEEHKGTKRKADEIEDEEEENDVTDDLDDAPATAEDTDLEAAGKAILEKAAADKQAADDAARTREPEDAVRFWESGWKARYYESKFGLELNDKDAIQHIVKSYCEGLIWVFKYYYQGCVSWSWYYPYYYAPMASDFENIESFDIKFEQSAPLKPFEQLMGVLPAASRDHIPKAFHDLMTYELSPIIDFYPTEFDVDMDGKMFAWQGVVKLPFIDTKRLLDAMSKYYDQLDEEERIRNSEGPSILYVGEPHKLYDTISEEVYTKRSEGKPVKLDVRYSEGMTGLVEKDPECIPASTLRNPLPNHDLEDIATDRSISVVYKLPELPKDFVFNTGLLQGLTLPPPVLDYEDQRIANFDKGFTNGRPNQNRGWVSQIDHMEEFRDQRNRRGGRGGGRGGYRGNSHHYQQQQHQSHGGYHGGQQYGGYNQGGDGYGYGYQQQQQQQHRGQYGYDQYGYGGGAGGGYNNQQQQQYGQYGGGYNQYGGSGYQDYRPRNPRGGGGGGQRGGYQQQRHHQQQQPPQQGGYRDNNSGGYYQGGGGYSGYRQGRGGYRPSYGR